ncbi:hypothetical protein MBLNU457_g0816t3 [Dothideomycetes sp. NU457]
MVVSAASKRWLTIFGPTTSASIATGPTSKVDRNARNATILYLVTSSTAINATSELAGDAGRTGCETLSLDSDCFRHGYTIGDGGTGSQIHGDGTETMPRILQFLTSRRA